MRRGRTGPGKSCSDLGDRRSGFGVTPSAHIQASQATLEERQANDDPLKWRKFVSYSEFTPSHTPAEEHHVPGYCGHVPGIYSGNLYAKVYGKTTLQAIDG